MKSLLPIFVLFGTALGQLKPVTEQLGLVAADANANLSISICQVKPTPPLCCNFDTQICKFQHNGRCMTGCAANNCDYLVDACPRSSNPKDVCTCCAFCDGPTISNECKKSGGICRRNCLKNEECDWDRKCSSYQCKCCKPKCERKPCGPNNTGVCLDSTDRPRGYYLHSYCSNKCGCYVPCSRETECNDKGGYCEWKGIKICMPGYKHENCYDCKESQCKCCAKFNIGPPGIMDGPIKIKSSSSFEVEIKNGGASGGGNNPPAENPEEDQKPEDEMAKESSG